jgi:hypothetical protein
MDCNRLIAEQEPSEQRLRASCDERGIEQNCFINLSTESMPYSDSNSVLTRG